jgi:hypothetical protein
MRKARDSSRWDARPATCGGQNAQNKANWPQTGRKDPRQGPRHSRCHPCGRQACETNPIPAGRDAAWGPGFPSRPSGLPVNCAKQTQFRQRRRRGKCFVRRELWWIEQSMSLGETKAVSRLRIADWAQTSARATNRAKRTQFPVSRALGNARLCKTKPICPAVRVSDKANRAKQSQFSRRCRAWLRGRGRGMLYKQSQFPPGQQEGQLLCEKGVMVNCTFDRPRRNKANSGGWDTPGGTTSRAVAWARCAKQTQFAPEGPAGRGTNKANLGKPGGDPGSRLCKTKPICPAVPGVAWGPGTWDAVQTKGATSILRTAHAERRSCL